MSEYRKANVYFNNIYCGILKESDVGYVFKYDDEYFYDEHTSSISLTMPKNKQVYESSILFPFFDGLIPEGYLFELVIKHFNIDYKDRFGALLKSCEDCIGAISLKEI